MVSKTSLGRKKRSIEVGGHKLVITGKLFRKQVTEATGAVMEEHVKSSQSIPSLVYLLEVRLPLGSEWKLSRLIIVATVLSP